MVSLEASVMNQKDYDEVSAFFGSDYSHLMPGHGPRDGSGDRMIVPEQGIPLRSKGKQG